MAKESAMSAPVVEPTEQEHCAGLGKHPDDGNLASQLGR